MSATLACVASRVAASFVIAFPFSPLSKANRNGAHASPSITKWPRLPGAGSDGKNGISSITKGAGASPNNVFTAARSGGAERQFTSSVCRCGASRRALR
ncbi:hypothetical protein D3C83_30280 [compost metagenome]